MSRLPEQPRPEPDDTIPPELWRDLSSLYPTPRVPAAVDARVLNGAAATLARQTRHRRLLRWVGAGAAAAAAVLVVALVLPRGGSHPAPYTLAGDADHNGRVDILDAFAVARQLRDAGGKPVTVNQINRVEDVNGDGVIDQKDVDLIARKAVNVSDKR